METQDWSVCRTLCEEINPSSIAAYIEIVLQTFTGLYSQLRQIISSIVSEQNDATRFQVSKAIIDDVFHSEKKNTKTNSETVSTPS